MISTLEVKHEKNARKGERGSTPSRVENAFKTKVTVDGNQSG